MKIHTDFDQHSLQWMQVRAGKLTASEADRLVTPLGKIKTGDGPKTLLLEKLAEKWTGAPLPNDAGSFLMEQGNILEELAIPSFELVTGLTLQRVAFIETDDENCGCSPDAVVEGFEIGVEAKCPGIVNHLRYLLDNCVPSDYILQCQFSMFVTGWPLWKFTSFRRKLPSLIVDVPRDEKLQYAIAQAVGEFNEQLAAAWEQLVRLNGAPPPPPKVFTATDDPPRFS